MLADIAPPFSCRNTSPRSLPDSEGNDGCSWELGDNFLKGLDILDFLVVLERLDFLEGLDWLDGLARVESRELDGAIGIHRCAVLRFLLLSNWNLWD